SRARTRTPTSGTRTQRAANYTTRERAEKRRERAPGRGFEPRPAGAKTQRAANYTTRERKHAWEDSNPQRLFGRELLYPLSYTHTHLRQAGGGVTDGNRTRELGDEHQGHNLARQTNIRLGHHEPATPDVRRNIQV